jgi:adenylosuccinate synthase
MVDLLSESYDIVARYQGGNNAGHTVVNARGKFILNLLPSGILRDETANVMGPGMVLDLEHLKKETGALTEKGVAITPEHLVISDRATICMPYHRMLDGLERTAWATGNSAPPAAGSRRSTRQIHEKNHPDGRPPARGDPARETARDRRVEKHHHPRLRGQEIEPGKRMTG